MARFKIVATLFYFLVFNLTIIIVHATPLDSVNENNLHSDNYECIEQIKFAYGGNFTATGCFRYAVEHYKKGLYIPGTPEQKLKYEGEKYENQTPPYRPVLNSVEATSNYQQGQNYGELTSIYQPGQNYGNATSSYQPEQTYGELSSIYQPVQTYGDPASIYQPGQNYGELTSIYQPDHVFNAERLDGGQISNEQEADQDFDFSDLPFDSFVGLKDFIEKGPPANVNPLYDPGTFVQIEPTLYVDGYQNPVLNSQAVPTFNADNSNQNPMINTEADIHRYGPNYAMEYYKELEKLIQGNGITTPISHCRRQFFGAENCLKSLGKFGTSAVSGVTVAFSDIVLSECTDQYVYSYVSFIKENIKIISPSKMPNKFCKEIYKLKQWYTQMKAYI